ncbi:MAG: cell envelope integrity EipB family protein [Nitratireductor sp.]|nr:cell envelope integrity EipB family protein [Nitratireductor sp.]
MNASIIRNLTAAPVLAALLATPAAASGFGILVPHRAVYDLSLKEASDRSGIEAMTGRIVYELSGNECDGVSIRYRFVTNITTSEEAYQTDQQTTTFESPNGLEFNFLTKSFVDKQLESTVKGTATRTKDGVKVVLSDPQRRDLELPPAIFISTHLIDIIGAAKDGEQLLKRDVFDGSDEADEVVASTTFIGEGKVVSEPLEGENAESVAMLEGQKTWPVTISYFEKGVGNAAESLPIYEASFLLYDNGISRKLTMRYPDYALTGDLTSLEMLKKVPCDSAQ